jgi:hypothetical protein
VSDGLFFLLGLQFKTISITHWRLRFHSSLRRLQDFYRFFWTHSLCTVKISRWSVATCLNLSQNYELFTFVR